MAVADWIAGTSISRALRIEPDNESFVARNAINRDSEGDISQEVDAELHRAHEMNSRDSLVLTTLAIRAEMRQDTKSAEEYFLQAAEVDRTFQPHWALANFYFRTGRQDRCWAALQQCLRIIEPTTQDHRTVNPEPAFELCWKLTSDSKKILDIIPPSRGIVLPYLQYLMRKDRTAALVEAMPRSLGFAPPGNDLPTYAELCDFLIRQNQTAPAVLVWNHLVDHAMLQSTRIDPNAGHSLADPDFLFPIFDRGFGWAGPHDEKVFATAGEHFVNIEMGGLAKEHFELLSKLFPVAGGTKYYLTWRMDPSRMDARFRETTGLALHLLEPAGELASCPVRLSAPNGNCQFTPHPGTTQIRMMLRYDRPLGEPQIEGDLRVLPFSMGFRS